MAIRIGIVGVGKIARDQHIPVIAASPDFELVATASPHGRVEDVPGYSTLEEMLAGPDPIDAVALCQPPQARFAAARTALEARKHVFLEKPPGATLSEMPILAKLAGDLGVTLYASWHSRYASGVEPARRWLADKRIRRVEVAWKEDVRHWHPGQAWIWQPGGLGVFDPGINALSIVTAILPQAFYLSRATLDFPQNRAAPIAAELAFAYADGAEIAAVFDWRQTGPQTWDIRVETDAGPLLLSKGGSELAIAGAAQSLPPEAEYRGLYDHFAALVRNGRSEVDLSPLRHVADAFLRGEHRFVEPFEDRRAQANPRQDGISRGSHLRGEAMASSAVTDLTTGLRTARPGATGRLRIHGSIAHDLGVAIVSGQYKPGDTLAGEVAFSHQMKVSRSAYREAIRMLAAKGLVASRPKAGTQVTAYSRWNLLDPDVLAWMFESQPPEGFIRDIFELRQIVEPAAAEFAAQRRTGRELALMGHALEEMEKYGLACEEGRAADQAFHHTILEATRNAPLVALGGTIAAAVSWTTIYKQRRRKLPRDPIPDHRAVYDAIADGNPAAARQAMADLVRLAFQDTELPPEPGA